MLKAGFSRARGIVRGVGQRFVCFAGTSGWFCGGRLRVRFGKEVNTKDEK